MGQSRLNAGCLSPQLTQRGNKLCIRAIARWMILRTILADRSSGPALLRYVPKALAAVTPFVWWQNWSQIEDHTGQAQLPRNINCRKNEFHPIRSRSVVQSTWRLDNMLESMSGSSLVLRSEAEYSVGMFLVNAFFCTNEAGIYVCTLKSRCSGESTRTLAACHRSQKTLA